MSRTSAVAFALLAPLGLATAACATLPDDAPATSGLTYARIGETVSVNGPQVTPLTLLEDSRCPSNVQCVWAGQLRVRIAVRTGQGTTTHEITSGKPIQIADGALLLDDALPHRRSDNAAKPADYRFGFRFDGGY